MKDYHIKYLKYKKLYKCIKEVVMNHKVIIYS